MDILQKHTAQFFGTVKHDIKRSGKVIYTARGVANSDLGFRVVRQRAAGAAHYQLQRAAQKQHGVT